MYYRTISGRLKGYTPGTLDLLRLRSSLLALITSAAFGADLLLVGGDFCLSGLMNCYAVTRPMRPVTRHVLDTGYRKYRYTASNSSVCQPELRILRCLIIAGDWRYI